MGETPGDGVWVHSHPLQSCATVSYHSSSGHSLGRSHGGGAAGLCGSPRVGSEDGAVGAGEASPAEGATSPPPCLAQGAWSELALTQVAVQRCWMAVPSGVGQETRAERGVRRAAAWGLPCPSPPVLVLADGALRPQQPSAVSGSRHTHHEREHPSLARKDPSQTDRHTDRQTCRLCCYLCPNSCIHRHLPLQVFLLAL